MPIDAIDKLLDHTIHPVVERYLVAFHNYEGELDKANRDDILRQTMTLDIDLNIRLIDISTEFFDENGDLIPTPDDWVAQELLGFESTYRTVTLDQIIADIAAYNENPADWPEFTEEKESC